jgi:4-hydroxybenzoate polyprenyltransferase
MAVHGSELAAFSNRRTGSLIAPREHGAWGLLLVPLFTGGIVGLLHTGAVFPLLALMVAALALFWSRTPAENWFGTGMMRAQTAQDRRTVATATFILWTIATLALMALFRDGRNHDLLFLGAIAAIAFLAQAILRKLSRNTRVLSQVVGTLGLTLSAPAAYYVVTGELNRTAWTLWIANFLFAVNQIHFVQLRIHCARRSGWSQKFAPGRSFLYGEVLLIVTLAFAWRFHFLPWLAALAFLPLILRGAFWFFEGQKPLLVRRLGWTELTYAIVFGVCLVAGFRFA